MKFYTSIATAIGMLVSAHAADAAIADHQHCFKIKDGLSGGSYSADLVPGDVTLPIAEGCTIKLPAKMICIGAETTDVTPTPPGSIAGNAAPNSLCYKVLCPSTELRLNETDQFGTRAITLKKSAFVCAPIPQSAPPTTTTSTTSTTAPTTSTSVPTTTTEATTTTLATCFPACGAIPHGETGCIDGACEIVSCDAGYGDCDGSAATGCETSISSDVNHCGACNTVCDLPHTFIHRCEDGVCEPAHCDPQTTNTYWADCNADPSDGCEHNGYSDPDACGDACEQCVSGECSAGTCVP